VAYSSMDPLMLDDIGHGSGQTVQNYQCECKILPSERCSVHASPTTLIYPTSYLSLSWVSFPKVQ